ncbi:MAG: DUF2334 domain-containing protein [Pseudomonadota bacterium]
MLKSLPPGDSYSAFLERKARLLADVIASHWNVTSEGLEMTRYVAGLAFDYDIIVVMDEYGSAIPDALQRDLVSILHRARLSMPGPRIVWTGLNSDALNALLFDLPQSAEQVAVSAISYKAQRFPGAGQQVHVSDWPTGVLVDSEVLAEGIDQFGRSIPYAYTITDSFLVLPFSPPSRYTINDASWVFLDLLHHVLGHHRTNAPKALLRLEDVNVDTYFAPDNLRKVYQYLKSRQIPFHIALIERYIHPAKGIDKELADGRRFFYLLQQMVSEGLGTLVQHGYTHQHGESVSGKGFEFWDEQKNAPLDNDSEELVRSTIEKVQSAMIRLGLPVPDIWETPHYALSALDDRAINTIYPLRYEHHLELGSLPFPVKTGGAIYIPENLGYISPDASYAEARSLDDMRRLVKRLAVFEDPVASFFWHPWRDFSELKFLIELFSNAGFQFESAYDLLQSANYAGKAEPPALSAWRSAYQPLLGYSITNYTIAAAYLVFLIGGLSYLVNLVRMRRHLKRVGSFEMSLSGLQEIARKRGRDLPRLAIFVPARNEAAVIENTIRQLAALDYPKHLYRAVIIVDEREREEGLKLRTIDVVKRIGGEINRQFNTDFVHCIEVPKWYSGIFGSNKRTFEKSTKGRALNYVLQTLQDREASNQALPSLQSGSAWDDYEMIGILDADGRLHPNVLKEVAYKRITYNSRLLQGPVFQVSNFGQVSLVGMCAALELAVHHLTTLPKRLLKGGKLQFVAGTNYFIDKDVIVDAGGWDCGALVEDAELALRLYVRDGVTAEWLDSPEIEQTPASFSIYRRQRERWVRGHFMLLQDVRRAKLALTEKLYLYNKIAFAQFRFIPEFTLAVLMIVFMFMGYLQDLDQMVSLLSIVLLFMALLIFNLYALTYWALRKYIPTPNRTGFSIIQYLKLFLFFPVFMVCQCVPRLQGIVNFIRRHHVAWYKTERTQEISGGVMFSGGSVSARSRNH